MNSINNTLLKGIRLLTITSLAFLVILGAVMVACQIRPFWVDEWFIIYNLKTRAAANMFAKLDFMQQFPRTYLVSLKYFTSQFNYSYQSLRLPSYVISLAAMALVWKVMKRIFEPHITTRYLLVLVLISSFTFLKYFVEMKQYPMDILLSIVALWQLLELLQIDYIKTVFVKRYMLLCLSFAIIPFFSYTYLLAVAPVYGVLFIRVVGILRTDGSMRPKFKTLILLWVPLIIGVGKYQRFLFN